MTRPKLALCLYGQFRTGAYCLPWIAQQFDFADVTVFGHLKTYESFSNLEDPTGADAISKGDVDKHVRANFKTVRDLTIIDRHENPFLTETAWHFTSLFSSMQVACLKALRDETDFQVIALCRTDVLLGPDLQFVRRILAANVTTYDSGICTIMADMPTIAGEARSGGIQDLFLMGSKSSMHKLIAGTYEVTASPQWSLWQRFHFIGPNLLLRRAAYDSNVNIRGLPLVPAVVRPNADLTIPVEQSFDYHKVFWTSNHRGMK